MQRQLFLAVAFIVANSAIAAPSAISPGSNLTSGPSSTTDSIFSVRHNPALSSVAINSTENFRMNYLPGLAVSVELGDVTNFVDDLDELIDILEDPSEAENSAQETVDEFNRVLVEMGDQGYVSVQNNITAPLLPFYWRPRFFPGTISAELELNTQIRMSVLDDELTFDDQNFSFSTATAAYLKSGIEKRLGISYSAEIPNDYTLKHFGAQLFAGMKLNVVNLELSKQVMRLQQLDGKDIQDVIEDEYENNLVSTTNLGIDIGVVLVASNYRAGFTITDLNSPSFDYGVIGENCQRYEEGSIQRNNCEAAAFFSGTKGDLKTSESHTKHPVATIDGAYYLLSNLSVSGSLDLASYNDIVGQENQWMNLSAAFSPKTFWLPAARIGYRQNLTGSQISSVVGGLSFFGIVSLDAEMAFDNVEVDGSSAPRRFAFSISVSERF